MKSAKCSLSETINTILNSDRISRDWSQFYKIGPDENLGKWVAAHEELSTALDQASRHYAEKTLGEDLLAHLGGDDSPLAEDAAFSATNPLAVTAVAALTSTASFYAVVSVMSPVWGLLASIVPFLIVASAYGIRKSNRTFTDRLASQAASLKGKLADITKEHQDAMHAAATGVNCIETSTDDPFGRSLATARCQVLWGTIQKSASVIDNIAKQARTEWLQLSTKSISRWQSSAEFGIGLMALVVVTAIGSTLMHFSGSSFMWSIAQGAITGTAIISAAIFGHFRARKRVAQKGAVIHAVFGNGQAPSAKKLASCTVNHPTHSAGLNHWSSLLLKNDPTLITARAMVTSTEAPPQARHVTRSATGFTGRGVGRLRLAVAPAEDIEKRFPREVWLP